MPCLLPAAHSIIILSVLGYCDVGVVLTAQILVQAGAVDDTDFLMQRFPGPLTPAVPKEKVLSMPRGPSPVPA